MALGRNKMPRLIATEYGAGLAGPHGSLCTLVSAETCHHERREYWKHHSDAMILAEYFVPRGYLVRRATARIMSETHPAMPVDFKAVF